MKPLWNSARIGHGNGTNTCNPPFGGIGQHPTPAGQAKPLPSSYYSAVTAAPRWTLPHQAPTMEGLHNLIAGKSENLLQVQKVCKDSQHRHE